MSRDGMGEILEKLTEQVALHMLNMRLAPELTKDLVVAAEKRAAQSLKQLFLDIVDEVEMGSETAIPLRRKIEAL